MKGIILSGGYGKRLRPSTIAIGKSLLPIYDKPMIYYAISLLIESGIDEILITCNKGEEIFYSKLFENKFDDFGVKIRIMTEEKPKGPAYGIYTAKDFCQGESAIVIFSDNVFLSKNLPNLIKEEINELKGATIFLKSVNDPHRFGIVELSDEGNILGIEEKPENPRSNLATTGLMIFDKDVFEKIKKLSPSKRGEYETTDLINDYLKEGRVNYKVLGNDVIWLDTGTHESIFECSNRVKEFEKENGLIGCPEVSVFKKGSMSQGALESLTESYPLNYRNKILRTLNL